MIFTSESGLTDPSRLAEWDQWYLGHLAAMVAVPGISSAQRFRALSEGVPPSLAMYTVASPAVFDSDIYRQTRGMGEFVPVVDERLHRRNLFDGMERAPAVPPDGILVVADRDAAEPLMEGLTWLRCVGLDRSVAYRYIAVAVSVDPARPQADPETAQRLAEWLAGAALYAPMTEMFTASGPANG